MSSVENFLRRWSTVDITPDNAILFEEHLMGVSIFARGKEKKLLVDLNRYTKREEFATRYKKLIHE